MPSAARFWIASAEVQSRRLATRSVSTRLISSGIDQSPERRPDSTWTMGTPSLAAASAAAIVELTSPATTSAAGR